MKKIIFLGLFLCIANFANAQKAGGKAVGIIASGTAVKKFHEKGELEAMTKGPLIDLYVERVRVLIGTLPYIALTNKQGVTLTDVGVPANAETDKNLTLHKEGIITFSKVTEDFQRSMMSYADKINIITAILYYEDMLKSLQALNE